MSKRLFLPKLTFCPLMRQVYYCPSLAVSPVMGMAPLSRRKAA